MLMPLLTLCNLFLLMPRISKHKQFCLCLLASTFSWNCAIFFPTNFHQNRIGKRWVWCEITKFPEFCRKHIKILVLFKYDRIGFFFFKKNKKILFRPKKSYFWGTKTSIGFFLHKKLFRAARGQFLLRKHIRTKMKNINRIFFPEKPDLSKNKNRIFFFHFSDFGRTIGFFFAEKIWKILFK